MRREPLAGMVLALALLAPILFPWPLAVALALLGTLASPFAPLAAGLFADTLYYVPHAALLPWWTLLGLAATLLALFVRRFVEASIM